MDLDHEHPDDLQLVELIAEECAYDQPCAHGHRVESHAVYCHNRTWEKAPRKCHRTWYSGGEERDEDCPGYLVNLRRKEA